MNTLTTNNNEETGLQVVEAYELIVPSGLTDLDQDLFSFPIWSLLHTGPNAGKFENSLTGQLTSQIECIVLKVSQSRFKWPEKFEPKNVLPVCYSINGLQPADQIGALENGLGVKSANSNQLFCQAVNQAGKNIQCPAQQWIKGNRPTCSLIINYLVVDIDTGVPALIRFQRGALDNAKKLNTFVRGFGVTHSVIIRPETTTSQAGYTYFRPKFEPGQPIDQPALYAAMVAQMRDVPLTSIIEDMRPEVFTSINPETGEVNSQVIN